MATTLEYGTAKTSNDAKKFWEDEGISEDEIAKKLTYLRLNLDLSKAAGEAIREIITDGCKTVFDEMGQTGLPAEQIVKEKGLVQISDTNAIEDVVIDVIASNSKEVDAYRKGKTKLLGFFVGRVMKETKGKANPKLVNEILKRKLG